MQFFLGYDSGFEQKKYIKNFLSSFRTQNALEKQKQIFFFIRLLLLDYKANFG